MAIEAEELALGDLQAPLLLLRVSSLFFDLGSAGHEAGKPLGHVVHELGAPELAPTAIGDLIERGDRIDQERHSRAPLYLPGDPAVRVRRRDGHSGGCWSGVEHRCLRWTVHLHSDGAIRARRLRVPSRAPELRWHTDEECGRHRVFGRASGHPHEQLPRRWKHRPRRPPSQQRLLQVPRFLLRFRQRPRQRISLPTRSSNGSNANSSMANLL